MQSMHDKHNEQRIDQALVVRASLNQDSQAFEQLVRRHQGVVRALLRRLTKGDHGLADDLAQETFLLAWRKLDQYRGEARFATWLYRIAYTNFLKQAEKVKSTASFTDGAAVDEVLVWCAAGEIDLRLDFERAMQRLNPTEQLVLLHCVQLDLSHEEVSQILGLPLGTVKTNATRAKSKLQTWLGVWKNDWKMREKKVKDNRTKGSA